MSSVKPCVFCDIVAGKSPETIIEFTNEHIVIFKDIRPASDHHYLAVPKNHMPNVRACTANDKDLSMISMSIFNLLQFPSSSKFLFKIFLLIFFFSSWNAKWAPQFVQHERCKFGRCFIWISLATIHQHKSFAYAWHCSCIENGIHCTTGFQTDKHVVLHGEH